MVISKNFWPKRGTGFVNHPALALLLALFNIFGFGYIAHMAFQGQNFPSGNPTSTPAVTFWAGGIDPTQTPYNVKFDAKSGSDGTTTSGNNIFSSTSQNCTTSDSGKLIIAVNNSNGVYAYGTGLVTITGCSGNSWVTSTNATVSLAGVAWWGIGTGTGTSTTGLAKAYADAIAASKVLLLPCGTAITTAPPFLAPATFNGITQHPDIQGCAASGGTGFILHPQITNGIASGNFFASSPFGSPSTGSIFTSGLGGQNKIENIFITSLRGAIPFASAQYNLIYNFNGVHNIALQELGSNNNLAQVNIINVPGGEAHVTQCNLQNTTVNGLTNQGGFLGVTMTGQGVNSVIDTIIAFPGFSNAIVCANGSACQVINDYIVQTSQGVSCSIGGCQLTITGSYITVSGGSGSQGAIFDNGTGARIYAFGNPRIETTQINFPTMTIAAGSTFELSANNILSNNSGFIASGSGNILDRGGNTWSSPLTNFTGNFTPLGGGSAAFNSKTATTNFGVNLAAQTAIFASINVAPAVYDVKLGFRQVTLGVGCGAGSNTVNGVLTWTSGGVVQSTGAGGVPALGTLTIAANGSVGSSSVYNSVPMAVDANTTVTFTTTSVLASAGCSTIPQYVVDYSDI